MSVLLILTGQSEDWVSDRLQFSLPVQQIVMQPAGQPSDLSSFLTSYHSLKPPSPLDTALTRVYNRPSPSPSTPPLSLSTTLSRPSDCPLLHLNTEPTEILPNGRTRGLLYSNPIDCIWKTIKAEGFFGLYKGSTAHFLRIAPHTVITLGEFSSCSLEKDMGADKMGDSGDSCERDHHGQVPGVQGIQGSSRGYVD